MPLERISQRFDDFSWTELYKAASEINARYYSPLQPSGFYSSPDELREYYRQLFHNGGEAILTTNEGKFTGLVACEPLMIDTEVGERRILRLFDLISNGSWGTLIQLAEAITVPFLNSPDWQKATIVGVVHHPDSSHAQRLIRFYERIGFIPSLTLSSDQGICVEMPLSLFVQKITTLLNCHKEGGEI